MAIEANSTGVLFLALYTLPSMIPFCPWAWEAVITNSNKTDNFLNDILSSFCMVDTVYSLNSNKRILFNKC
jgi:hypothetical protein